jgi:DNA polymerase III subunit delta
VKISLSYLERRKKMYRLFHGSNTYLSLRAIHSEIQKLENIELITIEADSTKNEVIADSLLSQGLFSSQKVYFLKRPYKNREKSELTEYILSILEKDETKNVLIWEDQKIRSNTRYFKFFKQHEAVEEYDELNKRSFSSWAQREIEHYPFKINVNELNLIGEKSNFNPETFVNNLEKLKLCGEENITKDIINELLADTLESDIWKLMDAINHQDKKSIGKHLEKLLISNTDPIFILSMIARNLRISIQVKELLDTGTSGREIPSILKLPPFTVYPLIDTLRGLSKDRILMQYSKLTNLDYEIKTGRINPILGLSLFTAIL